MKSKIFSLFGLSMLVFVMLVSFTSAAFTLTPSSLDFNKNDSSQTFTIANTDASNILNISLASQKITDTNGNNVTIVFNETSLSIAASGSSVVTATTSSLSSSFILGSFSKAYIIQETGNSTNNQTLTLSFLDSFCSSGSVDDTDLKLKVDINNRGEGDDDEWFPLDLIEIEIELENNKDNVDLNDVIFELGLFKENSNTNIIDDMIWISKDDEEVEVGDIDEDGDEKHTFEFRVDPTEVDEDDYWFVVKAYPDGDQSDTCIDHSENLDDFGSSEYIGEIQISKENEKEKMVIIDENSYPILTEAFCDASVTLSADIYNIGDKDFLDQIKVLLVNNELGLNLAEIVRGDLDEGEKTEVVFNFDIPSDAKEQQYVLAMEIFYDYDENDEFYDEVSDGTFDALLKVQGNCGASSTATQAVVSAVLESGGKAGEELVVKATITNAGDDTTTYILNAAGYSGWASSADISPTTLTLDSGKSKDVLVTFNVKSDASGEELFNIELVSDNQLVKRQQVSVEIESSSVFGGFLTGGVIGDNLYLWGLGLFNVVLILSIVFVVVRLLRK